MPSKKVGKAGENITAKYLVKKGYEIVKQNYSCKYGEIDIIAKKNDILAIIEVKSRCENTKYQAKENVTKKKQDKIKKTTLLFLSENDFGLQPRFDVCEVYFTKDRKVYINYIKNAYETTGDDIYDKDF